MYNSQSGLNVLSQTIFSSFQHTSPWGVLATLIFYTIWRCGAFDRFKYTWTKSMYLLILFAWPFKDTHDSDILKLNGSFVILASFSFRSDKEVDQCSDAQQLLSLSQLRKTIMEVIRLELSIFINNTIPWHVLHQWPSYFLPLSMCCEDSMFVPMNFIAYCWITMQKVNMVLIYYILTCYNSSCIEAPANTCIFNAVRLALSKWDRISHSSMTAGKLHGLV